MAKQKLPSAPATASDTYAHAIVDELRELNANFAKFFGSAEQPESGEVDLREPTKKPVTRDAKQAAAKVADEAVGPVTVETVETVDPSKPVGATRK